MIKHIGIVGLGSIGSKHLKLLRKNYPKIEITVVRSGKGVKYSEEKLATRIINSIDKLIELNPKAVIISSPASKHVDQALKLANEGIHILIEKPLSISTDGVKKLIKVIEQNKLIAQVGYMFRFDPCATIMKQYIDKNILGKILHVRIDCGSYLPEWRPNQDYKKSVSSSRHLGGGVLLELSHEFDYLTWFFGEISSVYAYLDNSKTLDVNVEDSAELIMISNSGFPISVHLDFNRRNKSRKCTIYGKLGELTWDAISKNISINKVGEKSIKKNFSFEMNDLYIAQIHHFFDCINNNELPVVTIKDGLNTIKLVEAAKKSNKTGKRLYLP